MTTDKATPKPYFTLTEPVPGSRILHLLGRAIVIQSKESLKRPIESRILPKLINEVPKAKTEQGGNKGEKQKEDGQQEHSPNPEQNEGPVKKEGVDLRDLDPFLYPNEVIEVENAEILLEHTEGESAKATISKWLSLFYSRDNSDKRVAKASRFRRVTVETQTQRIETMLKNEAYARPIYDFFDKFPDDKLGILVSIISCSNMEVGKTAESKKEGGVEGTVPGEAMGAPGADVGVKASAHRKVRKELKGTYDGEVIVACGYLSMTRKKLDPSLWDSLLGKKPKTEIGDIEISVDQINPKTMTVSVPPTRIPGDSEAILGSGTKSDASSADSDQGGTTVDALEDDEDLNFIITD